MYLDICVNGRRICESLKCRLVDERTKADKEANAQSLIIAQTIAQEYNTRIQKEGAGFLVECNLKLCDVVRAYEETHKKNGETSERSRTMHDLDQHLQKCFGTTYAAVTLGKVDKSFCLRFINYLKTTNCLTKKTTKKHVETKTLGNASQYTYMCAFISVLHYAVKKEYIQANPFDKIAANERIQKSNEHQREYLSVEELRTLMVQEHLTQTQRAFMFSCFCGLRISDIVGLKAMHIEYDGGHVYVRKSMQKTKKGIRLCLSDEALRYLPDVRTKRADEQVFDGLLHKNAINTHIDAWMKRSGINKHITFHCARHTYATLNLTAGTDIYTTSKLLGHSNVATTQIYARIIDKKKEEAAKALSNLFA